MSAATAGPLPPSSNIVATVEKDIVSAPAVAESTDTDAATTGDTGDRTQQQQQQQRQSPSSSTMEVISSYCSMVSTNLEYLADQLMKKSQKELNDEAILDEAIEEAVRERTGCYSASNLGKTLISSYTSCTSSDWNGGWSQSGDAADGPAGATEASIREGGGSNCTVATQDVSTSVNSDESTCVNSNRAPQSKNYVILDHTPVDDVDEPVNNKPTLKLRSLFSSLRRSSQRGARDEGTDNNKNNNGNNNTNRSLKWRSIRFGQKRASF